MGSSDCRRPDRALASLLAAASLIAVAATASAQNPPSQNPLSQTASPGIPASHHGPPQNRNAAIAELLANGFSSVTSLRKTGETWSGEGVRTAILVDFTIDATGALESHPAHR